MNNYVDIRMPINNVNHNNIRILIDNNTRICYFRDISMKDFWIDNALIDLNEGIVHTIAYMYNEEVDFRGKYFFKQEREPWI